MSGEGFFRRAAEFGADAFVDSQADQRADRFVNGLENQFLPGGSTGVLGQTIDTGLNTAINSEINGELNRFI